MAAGIAGEPCSQEGALNREGRNSSPQDAEKDTHLSSFESISPRPRMSFLPELDVCRGL